jgi:flagellar protein FliL
MAKAAKMDFDRGGKMAEEESEEGGGGGGKKLIVIIVIVLLLLGGGGTAAYLLLWKTPEETISQEEKIAEEQILDQDREQSSSADEKAVEPHYFHFKDAKDQGGEYVISLMDGKHFLRIKMVAEMEKKNVDAIEYLKVRMPLIDDIIISYFANMNTASIQSENSHQTIKKNIKKRLNALFVGDILQDSPPEKGNSFVKRVLITKIVLN